MKPIRALGALIAAACLWAGATTTGDAVGAGLPASGPGADALVLLNNTHTQCSGTLIHPHWVLTAKHCTRPTGQFDARVGTHTAHARTTTTVVAHPGADLALVYFPQAVPTAPAALARTHSHPGEQATAMGWGGTPLDALRGGATTPTMAAAVVRERFIAPDNIPDNQNLPYLEAEFAQSWLLRGDSGGPLFGPGGQLVGVASMGESQRAAGSSFASVLPGFSSADEPATGWYVPVAEYVDWIESTIATTPAAPEDTAEGPRAAPGTDEPSAPEAAAPAEPAPAAVVIPGLGVPIPVPQLLP